MTDPNIELLLKEYAKAEDNIGEVPCFVCRERPANKPVILVTDEELAGAPPGGSRAIIGGICTTCGILRTEEEMQLEMHNLMIYGTKT